MSFPGNIAGDFTDGYVFCNQPYPEIVRTHQHEHIFYTKSLAQVRGMAGKGKFGGLDIFFMNGRRDQSLNFFVLQRFYRRHQGFDRIRATGYR